MFLFKTNCQLIHIEIIICAENIFQTWSECSIFKFHLTCKLKPSFVYGTCWLEVWSILFEFGGTVNLRYFESSGTSCMWFPKSLNTTQIMNSAIGNALTYFGFWSVWVFRRLNLLMAFIIFSWYVHHRSTLRWTYISYFGSIWQYLTPWQRFLRIFGLNFHIPTWHLCDMNYIRSR